MILSGLKELKRSMDLQGEVRTVFPITVHNHGFSCIFMCDTDPWRLLITSLGKEAFTIEKCVEQNFYINSFLGEDYNLLSRYLNIKPSGDRKYLPNGFFEDLNRQTPKCHKNKPDYKAILRVIPNKETVDEADKVYFCGWRRNTYPKCVTTKNLLKTELAFGKAKAESCRQGNISSCWTVDETEERLMELNEFLSDSYQFAH
jgi:hypothetical protein